MFDEEEIADLLGRTVELSEAALHQLKKFSRQEIDLLVSTSEKRRVKHEDESEEEELFGKITTQKPESSVSEPSEEVKNKEEEVVMPLPQQTNSQAFFLPVRKCTPTEESLLYPMKLVRSYSLTDDGVHAKYVARASKLFIQIKHLGLSPQAENRLIELAGSRYNPSTREIKIVTSRHQRYQENLREGKKLVRELINEALLADPDYVPLKEYKALNEAECDEWNSNLLAAFRESHSEFVRPTEVPSSNERKYLEDVNINSIMENINSPFRLFTITPL
eukprot:TRINITY_DN327_c0_g1_i2.p1 TRINITY_DN327_c0_g1~~TRINITY_DN327_c0_g1_i2.p1  ORF type:complete len:304 (+),score=82.33 TRINITY_DN327_c0_g1_i2:82-912(+)